MKLYYATAACSLSPHIVAQELGLKLDLARVDTKTHKTAAGEDFYAINPKGYVPALVLDDGTLLTEGPAIVQYLADQKPEAKLAPANGTLQRYQLQEWLNYITSEIHKSLGSLFRPGVTPEQRAATVEALGPRYDFLSKSLGGKSWLMGETFTVADAYLFTVLNWNGFLKVDLANWPVLQQYQARVAARPAVQAALRAEGLIK